LRAREVERQLVLDPITGMGDSLYPDELKQLARSL
jgi:hypothetical protein